MAAHVSRTQRALQVSSERGSLKAVRICLRNKAPLGISGVPENQALRHAGLPAWNVGLRSVLDSCAELAAAYECNDDQSASN
jgi:hypothetical protein